MTKNNRGCERKVDECCEFYINASFYFLFFVFFAVPKTIFTQIGANCKPTVLLIVRLLRFLTKTNWRALTTGTSAAPSKMFRFPAGMMQ